MNLRTSQNSFASGLMKTINRSTRPMTKNKAKDEEIILGSVIEATLNLLKNIETNTTKINELKSELFNSGGSQKKKWSS